ncbi:MAG TPA: helix-turn-helix domain-containing protein [Luteimonas sp.]|nr:helix-turn-helix domain-containing protein [Luteimonas sp.]
MIRFGPWSTTLAAGMVFGALVALLLAVSRRNAIANRLLAGVIMVIVLKLGPYVLGFAGFFDAYPWLSFVPLSFGLALGPLLYLHVVRLTSGRLPPRWGWHLLPAALQFGYYLVMFAQPLAVKNAWADRVDAPWIDPAETWLELASLLSYLALSLRQHRRYQAWLDATLSNRDQFRIQGLRNVLVLMAVILPLWAAYEAASALLQFDYFQRMPLYVALTALVTWLGLEGWRNADLAYPQPAAVDDTRPAATPPVPRDWSIEGRQWRLQLQAAGWWRDPDLSLDRLARYLGTNTSYLSRAFNEGLGQTFNAVVNGLRVEAVQARLSEDASGDLLALAQWAGFNSKSSFNRWFKAQAGVAPSEYRAGARRTRARP